MEAAICVNETKFLNLFMKRFTRDRVVLIIPPAIPPKFWPGPS